MDEKTIEQLEGVAALDRRHHDTTNETGRRCNRISWQNWVIIGITAVNLIFGAALWFDRTSTEMAEIEKLKAQNAALLAAMPQESRDALQRLGDYVRQHGAEEWRKASTRLWSVREEGKEVYTSGKSKRRHGDDG